MSAGETNLSRVIGQGGLKGQGTLMRAPELVASGVPGDVPVPYQTQRAEEQPSGA